MRTRSQRKPSTSPGTADTKSHSTEADSRLEVDWDHVEVYDMYFDELTNRYWVFLRWPDGHESKRPREEAYAKCPQQVSPDIPFWHPLITV